MRRHVLIAAVVAALATGAWSAASYAAPSLPGLIYAADTYWPGLGPVTVNPNSGAVAARCAGDPSHSTLRLFVESRDGELVWSDQSCVQSTLFADATLSTGYAKWSPSDTHIAFLATPRTDPPSYESTIYLATVVWGSAGLSVSDVRAIHSLPYGGTVFNWTPDGERLVFAHANPDHKRSPDDPDASAPSDIYWLSVADGAKGNLTDTSDTSEYQPSVSPNGQRVAFIRQTVVRGVVRSDVFTMPATGGTAVQVTSKSNTNASSNRQPVWSPDGAHLGFACAPNSLNSGTHVCRIDALGRTKAVDLTPKTTASFWTVAWRS